MAPRARYGWVLQTLGIIALMCTIATDYGMGAWKASPPDWVYLAMGFVALGVSPRTMREILIAVFTKKFGGDDE